MWKEEDMAISDTAERDDVELMLRLLESRLSGALSDDHRAAVGSRLADSGQRLERLRQVHLDNGDEPAPGFRPYRTRETGA